MFILNGKEYNLNDLSVLKNFKKENLIMDPYPYIIIENCLDEDIYNHLENTYPNDNLIFNEDIQKHSKIQKNIRYQINASNTLKNNNIDNIWKFFVKYHTSNEFFKQLESIFNTELLYNTKNKFKKINKNSIGIRNIDSKDILMDCQIGINSISNVKNCVIKPHIDNQKKIYSGLLYMKHKDDISNGGDLNLYNIKYKYSNIDEFTKIIKNNNINNLTNNHEWDLNQLKLINTVKYKKNTFIIFLNQLNSIHSVSDREPNIYSRRLINIISEFNI